MVVGHFESPECLQKKDEDRSSDHWIWQDEVTLILIRSSAHGVGEMEVQSEPIEKGTRGEDVQATTTNGSGKY